MDPYLEDPALWPDVHNSLIVAIRDVMAPEVAPNYYVRLERRTFIVRPDDIVFVGRPDVAVVAAEDPGAGSALPLAEAGVVQVTVPLADEVDENFLQVHDAATGQVVTVMELRSPANKLHHQGREDYERKRAYIFRSRTNLVEVDLLRDGEPMSLGGKQVASDYRILVSRGTTRPAAQLYPFGIRESIPSFYLPLLPGDDEPLVELNTILHDLYGRARYDLSLDYGRPPVSPLAAEDARLAFECTQRRNDDEGVLGRGHLDACFDSNLPAAAAASACA